jgi:hypothetical protein
VPVVIFSGALVRLLDGGAGIDRFEGRERTEFVAVTLAGGDAAAIEAALDAFFGPVPLAVTRVPSVGDLGEGKPCRYVSHASL